MSPSHNENESIKRLLDSALADYDRSAQERSTSIDEFVAQFSGLGETFCDQLRNELERRDDQDVQDSPDDASRQFATEVWDADPSAFETDYHEASQKQAASIQSAARIGDIIKDYRLEREIGRGGMGVVYAAEHQSTGRLVALKLLSPDLPRTDATIDRFLNEASLAAALSHERSTFVFEAGEQNGQFFIAMELMSGKTLADVVRQQGPQPVSRAVDYILNVIDGLSAAHDLGVVHRDVKPSNCFIDDDGGVKVGDFGLSKSLVSNSDLTRTGSFLGTPQFAAPEQFRKGEADARTDIFAVGATLYYLIAGEAPFQGDPAAVIAQIVADEPPPLCEKVSAVPKPLGRIVSQALAKKPEARFQDMVKLRRALQPYASKGSSIADAGRRLGAFFLDIILFNVVGNLIGIITALTLSDMEHFQLAVVATQSIVVLLYFYAQEWRYGGTIGKRLFGLRIIDDHGETPNYWRAGIRALLLPGLFWLAPSWLEINFLGQNAAVSDDLQLIFLNSLALQFAMIVVRAFVFMICFSTFRIRGEYRGLHEIFSGTRVIRVRDETVVAAKIPVLAVWTAPDMPSRVGPFQIEGIVSKLDQVTVFSGVDLKLKRRVWVHLFNSATNPLNQNRARLTRTTRPHWLQEGEDNGRYWFAVSAVDGVPFRLILKNGPLPWSTSCIALADAATELLQASRDDSLPSEIDFDHFWVDQNGHARLLDVPFGRTSARLSGDRPSQATSNTTTAIQEPDIQEPDIQEPDIDEANTTNRAYQMLRELALDCRRDVGLSGTAIDCVDRLPESVSSDAEFTEVVERLKTAIDTPHRLTWDDRLGILAATCGMETMVYYSIAILCGALAGAIDGYPLIYRITLAVLVALSLPALIGFWLRGGLAFRVNDIEVRKRNGRIASRLRCALRNIVAWLPILVTQAVSGVLLFELAYLESAEHRSSFDIQDLGVLTGLALVFAGSAIIPVVGAIWSIVKPRRGLQDLVMGTFLVRR